jgi:hypothetical protein
VPGLRKRPAKDDEREEGVDPVGGAETRYAVTSVHTVLLGLEY